MDILYHVIYTMWQLVNICAIESGEFCLIILYYQYHWHQIIPKQSNRFHVVYV